MMDVLVKHGRKRWLLLLIPALFLGVSHVTAQSGVSYQAALTSPSSINLSLPVGTLDGALAVSSSGAATYNIPIKIAPGTAGMEPKLAIAYSSQAGNGLLGWGWTLNGLNAITRVGPDNYHDGRVASVQWNSNDFYNLGGSRLVLNNNGTYGTECESWAKIEPQGTFGSGPAWFKVWLKDGTTQYYGEANNARLLNNSGTEVLAWKLSKTIDPSGNYIDYRYMVLNGENVLEDIWYTGSQTLGTLPYNRVKFNYALRSDQNTMYEGGSAYESKHLLTQIEVFADQSPVVRRYNIGYRYDGIHSFLQTVEECGSNGNCFNKNEFIYGIQNTEMEQASVSGLNFLGVATSYETIPADVDGDGLADVVQIKVVYKNGIRFNEELRVKRRNNQNGNFDLIYTLPLQNPSNPQEVYYNPSGIPNDYNFHVSDFDGDGADDLCVANLLEVSPGVYRFKKLSIIFGFRNVVAQNASPQTLDYTPPGLSSTYPKNFLQLADFDGDGRTDIMTIGGATAPYNNVVVNVTCPMKGQIFEPVNVVGTPFPPFNGSSNNTNALDYWMSQSEFCSPIDIDGDGRHEMAFATIQNNVIAAASKFYVFRFERDNSGVWQATKLVDNGYPTHYHSIFTGDFNGDRKTDLLTRTNDNSRIWEIALSTGTNFASGQVITLPSQPVVNMSFNSYYPSSSDKLFSVSDFNGDGKSDILYSSYTSTASLDELTLLYGAGNSNFSQKKLFYDYSNSSFNHLNRMNCMVADFSGDGKADVLTLDGSTGGGGGRLLTFRRNSKERIITDVRNGLGSIASLQYRNLTEYDGSTKKFYTYTGGSPYPFNTVKVPLQVVIQEWFATGAQSNSSKRYYYKDLKFHKGGKGMLGFETTEVKDLSTESLISNAVTDWNVSYYVPIKIEESVVNQKNGTNVPISKTTTNIDVTTVAGGRYRQVIASTLSENLLQGSSTEKKFNYDLNGNAWLVTSIVGDPSQTAELDTVETTYAPIASTLTPVPSKPEVVRHSHQRYPSAAVSTKTRFTYYNGAVQRKSEFWGQPASLNTFHILNQVGLPETTYVSSTYGGTRWSTTSYDSHYRFVNATTDLLGQTASTDYDPRWGVPLSNTSIDDLYTSYAYDEFGRRTETTVPDGYTITLNRNWSQNSPSQCYYETLVHPGNGTTITYFDKVGHDLESRKSLWGSGTSTEWSHVTKQYDGAGRLSKETAPHFTNETYLTTSYAYDDLNRVSSKCNALGCTNYAYSYPLYRAKVTITDPGGRKSSKESDAAGRLVRSITESGTVLYQYDSWGNQKSAAVPGSTGAYTESAVYDSYNRLVTTTNASQGTTQYTYNGFRERLSQTDAAGHVTTTTYDPLGRPTQRTGPEGSTTYSYWSSGAGSKGKIKKITGFTSGHIVDYSYTGEGHLSSVDETVNGQVTTTLYKYDAYGRVKQTFYPNNGPVVVNRYNEHGLLEGLSCNGSEFYTLNSVNGMGQALTVTRGNTLSSTNAYYYGIATDYNTPGIQEYHVSYDFSKGLITDRWDNAQSGASEQFQYDNAGRLASAKVSNSAFNPPQPQAIDYGTGAAADNIMAKSDVGGFKYHISKPHSLWYADNSQSQISSNDQDIVYTAFHRPDTIREDGWELQFEYGHDYERRRTFLMQNQTLQETREYFGSGAERHTDAATGVIRDIWYIPGPEGVALILLRESSSAAPLGVDKFYYPYSDHLGTITALTDELGTPAYTQAFDAWGRQRDPWLWMPSIGKPPADFAWLRGFTGHEHLLQFGLINMNARLYDPLLGRMCSPDNYIANPGDAGAYNRYAYANNNPISYTDPTGNFAGGVFFGINFVAELATNLITGASDPVDNAFLKTQASTQEIASSLQTTIPINDNSSLSLGFDPYSLGVSASYSRTDGNLTTGVGIGISPFGPYASGSASYQVGIVSVGGSFGTNFSSYSAGGGIGINYEGMSAGYYQTFYGGAAPYGGEKSHQWSGGIRAGLGDFSFRWENDFFMKFHNTGEDRWRTNAMEFSAGNISVGSWIYTNNPGDKNKPDHPMPSKYTRPSPLWGPNQTERNGYTTWSNGQVYAAPAYIAIRNGNVVSRLGYGHPVVQDLQQNWTHKQPRFPDGNQNYYLHYDHFELGGYSYQGFYNPTSIYGF